MSLDLGDLPAPYLSFWRERHVCTLTTPRPNGTPHVVPVGVTYDPETRTARVLANRFSRKVAHVLAATEGTEDTGDTGDTGDGAGGARVAVCQFEGRRWATLEGAAVIAAEPERVTEGMRRYEERYGRVPSPNPDRVVIEIRVDRALGSRALAGTTPDPAALGPADPGPTAPVRR
ncbi:pyridoxamine 5'-phosphate oxidase family protein [Streptomyces aureocirculatus]|uniref:pyridoxamine 5'-phosphate oxidase family protein n=1 Tax=Streptomyces aureocirculatus TaxID=67275 RepID=UPI00068F38AA|nr:pyridoxamine 5'-phosphate oxidase family protein [Streptomyces aureocirculatus]